MDKKYQVFISSTFEDLQDERKEILQAILELDCMPVGMELFPAANDDQFTLIKRVIDGCDYYVLVIGGRYGSVNPKTGLNYTEMEFDYAASQGKLILAFLHGEPSKIPAGKTEKTDEGKRKLEAFKEKVKTDRHCKMWETGFQLGGVVSRSLVQAINSKPGIGWVRADPKTIEQLSSTEILRLKKHIEELQGEIQRIKTAAPTGTEHLAQGQDRFKINFLVYIRQDQSPYSEKNVRVEQDLSWNGIYYRLAPLMIDQASENDLIQSLDGMLLPYYDVPKGYMRINLNIWSESFKTIKVQLMALGLIVPSDKKKAASDRNTYWKLTPYGMTLMTQLRAIRKEPVLE